MFLLYVCVCTSDLTLYDCCQNWFCLAILWRIFSNYFNIYFTKSRKISEGVSTYLFYLIMHVVITKIIKKISTLSKYLPLINIYDLILRVSDSFYTPPHEVAKNYVISSEKVHARLCVCPPR